MRLLATILLCALAFAACDDGNGDGNGAGAGDGTATTTSSLADTTTTTGNGDEIALGATCANPEIGYQVDYPEHWNTNSGDVVAECSYFDPFPVEVPEATEAVGFAIGMRAEPVSLETVTGDSPARDVVNREETTVDGQEAVILETIATGEALLPEGTEALHVYVRLGDSSTFVAGTYEVPGNSYDYNKRVLRAMADTLDLPDGDGG